MIAAKKSLVGVMPKKESITGKVGVGIKTIYPPLIDLEVTPTKEIQTFKHEDSYGYDNVVIDPIPEEYIIPNGTLDITQNGDVDVTDFKMAKVNVDTTPNLQDKSIIINENGITTVKADEGYDGLNNVEVSVDAIEDLEEEITTYNNELSEQEEQLTNIIQSLKNKAGNKTPEVGFVVNECDGDGYATKITTYGFTSIPAYGIGATSTNILNMLSKKVVEIILNDEVTSLGNYAIASCTNLVTVRLPETLTTINTYAFKGSSSLVLDKLPNSLTSLAASSFESCSSIRIKQLPDSLTTIANGAFYGCTSLTQLSMKNVKTINGTGTSYSPFYNCTGLKAVWIGSAITSSGFNRYAFAGCTNITKMFIDLPRATVEAFKNYQYAFASWSSSTQSLTTDVIVCNDDAEFITKEEFDAIDWATYSE